MICEKPLATSVENAQKLVALARQKNRRNCTFHNLRFYPMVQQMRRMREAGDLGEILVVQGTYSQDWLLYDTDWNWRIDSKDNGPSRCLADIGSHWCDMAEHVTGAAHHVAVRRPADVPQDAQAAQGTHRDLRRQDPQAGGLRGSAHRHGGFRRGGLPHGRPHARRLHRQPGVGRPQEPAEHRDLRQQGVVAWNQERPDELWIGQRNSPNQIMIKDPSLMKRAARPYADLPGGHSEGYDDTFKQVFRRFYQSMDDPAAPIEYPQFVDGLRQLQILEAELASQPRAPGWTCRLPLRWVLGPRCRVLAYSSQSQRPV